MAQREMVQLLFCIIHCGAPHQQSALEDHDQARDPLVFFSICSIYLESMPRPSLILTRCDLPFSSVALETEQERSESFSFYSSFLLIQIKIVDNFVVRYVRVDNISL